MVLSGSYTNEDKQLVEEQFWMLWQKLWKWKYLSTEQIFIQIDYTTESQVFLNIQMEI